MKPLDFAQSIKIKLGIVILAATMVAVVVASVGAWSNFSPVITTLIAGALSLTMVQLLARGMTSPLRDMAKAARAMASGDYSQTIPETRSRDEVGELARAFDTMARELAETDRIRRDLVANVSHELRTPISGLRAALENLVDGVAAPDKATFEAMLMQTERLGHLVAELLDLSRLESGAAHLTLSKVNVESIFEDTSRAVGMTRPDLRLLHDVRPGGAYVVADEERLRQVVTNLVANAARVTPIDGSVTLSFDGTGEVAVLTVVDEGPGIPESERKRVFERFYRADSARSADDSGAGLGLAIVKWIVELHGGTITPESATGSSGCRMVVRLPKLSQTEVGQ